MAMSSVEVVFIFLVFNFNNRLESFPRSTGIWKKKNERGKKRLG
jgi:hypothetical protein